ncbi:unnamed protein product [marine sediment metagenome]|uniref:Uncharacterized protein n=1 Tax=marine sediment metagenome TaxID=412755 RepID=X0W6V7_9ZZZZ
MAEIKFKVILEAIIKSNTDWYHTNLDNLTVSHLTGWDTVSKMEMAKIEEENFKNEPELFLELAKNFKVIVEPI